jgi:hypothetical protein
MVVDQQHEVGQTEVFVEERGCLFQQPVRVLVELPGAGYEHMPGHTGVSAPPA